MAPHDPLTFVAALKAYEKHCLAEGLSKSTVENKRCNIELFIKWALADGIDSPEEVTKQIGENYKAYLVEYISPHTGRALKKSTRRKRVSDVRVFFAELTYLDYFEINIDHFNQVCDDYTNYELFELDKNDELIRRADGSPKLKNSFNCFQPQ